MLDRELEREHEPGEGGQAPGGGSRGVSPPPAEPATGGGIGGGDGSGDDGDGGGSSEAATASRVAIRRRRWRGGGESGGGGGDESSLLPFHLGIEGTAYAAGGATLVSAGNGFTTIDTEEAGEVRVLTRPVRGVNGRRLGTFRAADPLASVELTRKGLRNTFLIVGLTALLISTAVAFSLASYITRPLRRMARFASAVDAGDLTHRLPHTGGGEEVEVLADSFDGMLDRLEQAFTRQQEFVSDASHELRTPLTVLRGQVDLLRRTGGDPARA